MLEGRVRYGIGFDLFDDRLLVAAPEPEQPACSAFDHAGADCAAGAAACVLRAAARAPRAVATPEEEVAMSREGGTCVRSGFEFGPLLRANTHVTTGQTQV